MVIPELIAERRFGRIILCNLILQRGQALLEALLILFMLPVVFNEGFPAGALAVTLVMGGILAVVILMISQYSVSPRAV